MPLIRDAGTVRCLTNRESQKTCISSVPKKPFFRFANIGHRWAAEFTTAFFSGVVANAMLLDFYKEENIYRRQLFLIYTLVLVVNVMGGFDVARQWLARFVVTSVLPVESLSVVILSFAAEFTSGFAAAGALMDAH